MFRVIVAVDEKNGIARDGKIPWYYKEDMRHFYKTTMSNSTVDNPNILIMGRRTFEQTGILPGRITCVLTSSTTSLSSNSQTTNSVYYFNNILDCVKWCSKRKTTVFICGGASIYDQFMDLGIVSIEYLSRIASDYNCTKFYTPYEKRYPTRTLQTTVYDHFTLTTNLIVNYEEEAFIQLIDNILSYGNHQSTRTGVKAVSLFGKQLVFDLSNNTFPLLTSRRMFLRGIFEELMFILRGQTDTKILEKKGINIWKKNTSKEFLKSRNLDYKEGEIGHTYGYSMRHFGSKYEDPNDNGFDQLTSIVDKIKNEPDRRLLISLWEPNYMHKAVLPPCIYSYQFYVNNKLLSCKVVQRSSDVVCAGGWNIASSALFLILVAKVCELTPHELIWSVGDIHIYDNLVDAAKEMLQQSIYVFPKLYIKDKPTDWQITDYQFEDLTLVNYVQGKKIHTIVN